MVDLKTKDRVNIQRYKKAETICEKLMCVIAKITHGKVITPLGRIVLLPFDFDKLNQ